MYSTSCLEDMMARNGALLNFSTLISARWRVNGSMKHSRFDTL